MKNLKRLVIWTVILLLMTKDSIKDSVEKIKLDEDNRMLRIGFGKNKEQWFFRIDL